MWDSFCLLQKEWDFMVVKAKGDPATKLNIFLTDYTFKNSNKEQIIWNPEPVRGIMRLRLCANHKFCVWRQFDLKNTYHPKLKGQKAWMQCNLISTMYNEKVTLHFLNF